MPQEWPPHTPAPRPNVQAAGRDGSVPVDIGSVVCGHTGDDVGDAEAAASCAMQAFQFAAERLVRKHARCRTRRDEPVDQASGVEHVGAIALRCIGVSRTSTTSAPETSYS